MGREIIVYREWGRIRIRESNDDGIFENVSLTTHIDESPAVIISSTVKDLDRVKVMDNEVKRQYLEIDQQIKDLQRKQWQLLEANFEKMPSLTWGYMRAHQTHTHIPEVFKHKNLITALRRGSKVMVDASTDAVRWRMACKVGKLRKKGPKNAVVEIEGKCYRIPYYVLLPYDYQEWLREKRKIKETERQVQMSDDVCRALNRIIA